MNLNKFFKKSKSTIVFIIFFSLIFIPIVIFLIKPKTKLPVYNPADVNPILVDDAVRHISKDHRIANFSLLDQNGDTITQNNFKNKISTEFIKEALIKPLRY